MFFSIPCARYFWHLSMININTIFYTRQSWKKAWQVFPLLTLNRIRTIHVGTREGLGIGHMDMEKRKTRWEAIPYSEREAIPYFSFYLHNIHKLGNKWLRWLKFSGKIKKFECYCWGNKSLEKKCWNIFKYGAFQNESREGYNHYNVYDGLVWLKYN